MGKKTMLIGAPQPDEYPDYAEMYIKWVPKDGRILEHLKDQVKRTITMMEGLGKKELAYVYAPGKWTIPEVLVHILDDERIYAYRALRIGRGDETALPGFDQELFAANSGANERTVKSILKEYVTVRKATLSLFGSFSEEALLRRGNANGHVVSARGLLYHLAGHELHHLEIIKEKYLCKTGV